MATQKQDTDFRLQIRKMVDYISDNFVAEVPRHIYEPGRNPWDDMSEFERMLKGGVDPNSPYQRITTTFLILNSCLNGNTLIEGDSGTGKSKLASVVGSMLYQIPYELFERKRVVGTPGAMVNEIYATHDIAELNQGNDVAFLYLPFYAPFLIIDELNRFSELEQNRIREGVATGVWQYSNHSWNIGNQIVVSAINPESYGGTFFLNENLLDNYSLVLPPAFYNSVIHADRVRRAESLIRERLGLEDEVNKIMTIYTGNKNDVRFVQDSIQQMQEQMLRSLKAKGVPLIHNGFIGEIRKQIEAVKLDPEAYLFMNAALAEMTYSAKFGRLRNGDPKSDDSHDQTYLISMLKEPLAGRFLKDWTSISQAVAWYMGKSEVEVEDLKAAFIYTACRRLKPDEKFHQDVLNSPRRLPVNFELARRTIDLAWQNYSGFMNSGENQAVNTIRKAVNLIHKGGEEGLLESVRILQGVDHPLATALLEGIFTEIYESNGRAAK